MENDGNVVSECVIRNIEKNGFEQGVKSNILFDKATKIQKLLEIMISGKDLNYDKNDNKQNTELLLNLLHFKLYVLTYETIFNEWHNPLFENTNSKLSDKFYLIMANEAKQLHEIYNSSVYENAISDLLLIKVNYDETKIDKLYDVCMKIVEREWIDAGLVKSKK